MVEIVCKAPRDCSDVEIDAFCNLVQLGGQVDEVNLRVGVKRARVLSFAVVGEEFVGVGGLKSPLVGYRDKVFRKAGIDGATNYETEFGWVFVLGEYRNRKVSRAIAEALLKSPCPQLYATSLVSNEPMHRTLGRYGFERVGQTYLSNEHRDEQIALFIREAV